MPNPRFLSTKTLASLKKGEALEFECGRCGHSGLVTLLQLVRRNISLNTRLEDLLERSFCKRCGKADPRNRLRVRNGRD